MPVWCSRGCGKRQETQTNLVQGEKESKQVASEAGGGGGRVFAWAAETKAVQRDGLCREVATHNRRSPGGRPCSNATRMETRASRRQQPSPTTERERERERERENLNGCDSRTEAHHPPMVGDKDQNKRGRWPTELVTLSATRKHRSKRGCDGTMEFGLEDVCSEEGGERGKTV